MKLALFTAIIASWLIALVVASNVYAGEPQTDTELMCSYGYEDAEEGADLDVLASEFCVQVRKEVAEREES